MKTMKMACYPSGLGIIAMAYIGIDYLKEIDPELHNMLRPLLWGFFAIAITMRGWYYEYWTNELQSIRIFIGSLIFMLSCLCIEAIAVQYVTTILGLDWHWSASPLPDSGQWLTLFLNEKLPKPIVSFLQAPVIRLHHFLMLFLLLCFSVLYGCVEAPGMGIGARYMFAMGVGRLIRILTFCGTILPSPRPWCAHSRFKTADHPHPWVQKYYMPYANNPYMVKEVINKDIAFVPIDNYPPEYVPDWGLLQFLVNFLRPIDLAQSGLKQGNWFHTLKRAGGGCNDLVFSGHMYVAALTGMVWQEAYPGWTSIVMWGLVAHNAQREIRERHHYSVDVVIGIYTAIFVWRTTRWIWPSKDSTKLEITQVVAMQDDIQKAALKGDLEEVKLILSKNNKFEKEKKMSPWATIICGGFILLMTLSVGLLILVWTENG